MISSRLKIRFSCVPLLAAWTLASTVNAQQYEPQQVQSQLYPATVHVAPRHLVIQAPRPLPAANAQGGYAGPDAVYFDQSNASSIPGNQFPGNPIPGTPPPAAHVPFSHHLPELPGVENDPSGAGPGQLGVGAYWLKSSPQSRAMIPNATVVPTWKAPYSYGYFGSEGKRHWTRQNGYRDRSMQWTLR